MRKIKQIFKIQPLQIDTVELLPMSAVPGIMKAVVDVTGTGLADAVSLSRLDGNIPLLDGNYQIKVTSEKKVTISDLTRGTVSAEYDCTAATDEAPVVISDAIPGAKLSVKNITSVAQGNMAEVEIIGDQTYIIPGTILGRIKSGMNAGKWKPVSESDISGYDCFRIASTVQETDKTKTVLPHGYESNLSDVFTIDVIVYGQIYESVCRDINLTDDLKKQLSFIAWQ